MRISYKHLKQVLVTRKLGQFFREPYRKLIDLIKNHSPNVKVVYHSDGAMAAFLPKLVDIGADVFHSVEPLPAWDLGTVKHQYGGRIAFMGGIDIREALQGDEAGVEAEVKQRLRELGPGGGPDGGTKGGCVVIDSTLQPGSQPAAPVMSTSVPQRSRRRSA